MCGIVGHQGTVSDALIEQMTAAVAHRGPDGQGTVRLETPGAIPTSLGHRRLAIIDLSEAGRQPMVADPDGGRGGATSGLTLVYNGEIYNYRELRADLESAGHRFRTRTDSEVLLHLYEQHGVEMVSHLNGIFTIAIHDARPADRPDGVDRGALFVARDQLGVKPLECAVAPHHPLAAATHVITDTEHMHHRAVAVADSAQRLAPLTVNLLPGQDVLTVSTMSAKIEALLRCMGCGFIPEQMVREHIAAGHLVAKPVQRPPLNARMSYAWRSAPTGSAARKPQLGLALRWWLDQLESPATRKALLERHSGRLPLGGC